jgi:hypothetical protein
MDTNRNGVDRTDDRLVGNSKDELFRILQPFKYLAVDEVIVKFKGRVVFKHYIVKKHKHLCIKMFKLCNCTGYTYDMNVCLSKDRQRAAQHLTPTCDTMINLTRAINCTWTTSFLPLTCLTTHRKFPVVGK